jgi:hypothetical protein
VSRSLCSHRGSHSALLHLLRPPSAKMGWAATRPQPRLACGTAEVARLSRPSLQLLQRILTLNLLLGTRSTSDAKVHTAPPQVPIVQGLQYRSRYKVRLLPCLSLIVVATSLRILHKQQIWLQTLLPTSMHMLSHPRKRNCRRREADV